MPSCWLLSRTSPLASRVVGETLIADGGYILDIEWLRISPPVQRINVFSVLVMNKEVFVKFSGLLLLDGEN